MKTCSKCGIEQNKNEFARDNSRKSGYKSQCRTCHKVYYLKNIDNISNVRNIWYQNHKNDEREYKRIYNKNNKDYIKIYHANYYKINKERIDINNREYAKANLGKMCAYTRKYTLNKINATISGFDKEIELIYTKAKDLEKSDGIKRHVHHITPLQEFNYLGIFGLHVPWNLEILTEEEHVEEHRKLRSIVSIAHPIKAE